MLGFFPFPFFFSFFLQHIHRYFAAHGLNKTCFPHISVHNVTKRLQCCWDSFPPQFVFCASFTWGYRGGNQVEEITRVWDCGRGHLSPEWNLVANGALDARSFHRQTEASPPGNICPCVHLQNHALLCRLGSPKSIILLRCVLPNIGLQTSSG